MRGSLRLYLLHLLTLLILAPRARSGYRERSFQLVVDCIHTGLERTDFANLSMLDFGANEIHNYCRMTEDECTGAYLLATDGSNSSIFRQYKYRPRSWMVGGFFKHLGMEYLAMDINGMKDSTTVDTRLDLSLDDNLKHLRFDVVANIGFSEHVGEGDSRERFFVNQYNQFKNAHMFGKENSVHINEVPRIGSYRGHGVAHYDRSFFAELADQNNYEVLYNFVSEYSQGLQHHEYNVYAAYVKRYDVPFMSFEAFRKLPGLRSIYSDYDVMKIGFNYEGTDYAFMIDFKRVSSEQAAEEYCTGYLMSQLKFDSPVSCVTQIKRIIDSHKIENTIRT